MLVLAENTRLLSNPMQTQNKSELALTRLIALGATAEYEKHLDKH